MVAVKIVTDSLGDIPSEVVEELGITIIPIDVLFGTKSYRDGVDLTADQFYRKLMHSKILPTTRIPALGVFVQTYDKLAGETGEIVVITSSHKLSASYEATLQAVELMKKKKCRVEVIDSGWAVMAQGLIVMEAARAAQAGASLNEVVALVRKNIPRADVRMAFDTLDYLKEGGRIGKAQTFLGAVLRVTPILGIKNGVVYPFTREHSRARAVDYLYDFAASFSRIDGIAVEDATTPDDADMLAERLSSKFPKERIYRSKVGAGIGVHVGPRVLGVALLGDK